LAGVAKVRHDGVDAFGRSTLQSVHHDQQFHQVVVGGGAGGLNDKDVAGTHVLVDLDQHFTVRKTAYGGCTQRHTEVAGNVRGQGGIGVAGKNQKVRSLYGLHERPSGQE
jgi:hypothetical protein